MFNYDKLETCIEKSGKTKAYLCSKVGRPRYYLRDVIKQRNSIPLEYQQILADELGVSIEWLNDETDIKEKVTANGDDLSDREKEMLKAFRSLSDEEQELFLKMFAVSQK